MASTISPAVGLKGFRFHAEFFESSYLLIDFLKGRAAIDLGPLPRRFRFGPCMTRIFIDIQFELPITGYRPPITVLLEFVLYPGIIVLRT